MGGSKLGGVGVCVCKFRWRCALVEGGGQEQGLAREEGIDFERCVCVCICMSVDRVSGQGMEGEWEGGETHGQCGTSHLRVCVFVCVCVYLYVALCGCKGLV